MATAFLMTFMFDGPFGASEGGGGETQPDPPAVFLRPIERITLLLPIES